MSYILDHCPIPECNHSARKHYQSDDGSIHCTAGGAWRCRCTLTENEHRVIKDEYSHYLTGIIIDSALSYR